MKSGTATHPQYNFRKQLFSRLFISSDFDSAFDVVYFHLTSPNSTPPSAWLHYPLTRINVLLTFTKQYDDANLMPTRELEKQAKHSGVHTHTCASCLRRVTACGNTASRRRRREAEPESRFREHIQPQTHKHTHNLADTCTGSLREESFQTELNQGGEICNQVTHCILYRAKTNTYAQTCSTESWTSKHC